MLNASLKQEILKSIDITRQSAKNNLDIMLESYMEIIGRLDLLTYLLINQDKILSKLILKISFFSPVTSTFPL